MNLRKLEISVIICTYNRADSLRTTLTSLRECSSKTDVAWEIIVVDNNSNDHTAAVVSEFAANCTVPVRYVFEKEQGLAQARNRGIKDAQGDIVSFIDDDITVAETWLRAIHSTFASDDAAGVGGKILPLFEETRPRWLTAELSGFVGILDRGDKREYVNSPKDIWGANFSVKRNIFESHGVFDTRLGRKGDKLYTGEETDFFRRLLSAGVRLFYEPRIVVWHRIPASHTTKRYFRKRTFHIGQHHAWLEPPPKTRAFFGVPYWMLRQLATSAIRYTFAICGRRVKAFEYQLRVVYCFGFIGCRLRSIRSSPLV